MYRSKICLYLVQCESADRCTNLRLPEIFMKLKISKSCLTIYMRVFQMRRHQISMTTKSWWIHLYINNHKLVAWPLECEVTESLKEIKRFIYGLYLQYPLNVCLSVVFIWYVPVCLHNSSIVYLWSFSALSIKCLFTFGVCLHSPCSVCLAVEFVCIVPTVSVYL